jgi:hypothetical protein
MVIFTRFRLKDFLTLWSAGDQVRNLTLGCERTVQVDRKITSPEDANRQDL